jgi:cytochrome c peroxidase
MFTAILRVAPFCAALLILCLPQISAASELTISMRHHVAGQRLTLDSLRLTNTDKETFSISRLSYLLSEFALETEEGQWVELTDSVAWIDYGKRRTEFSLPNIPEGDYRAIRFSVGVDEARNHADPAQYKATHPLNPNLNQLHWNWQGGYIFLALEGRTRTGDELAGYVYHLANDANRTRINLPLKLDLSKDAGLEIAFDLAALFNSPEPISFATDGSSTHSPPDDVIANKLSRNLPSAFQIMRVIEFAAKSASPPAAPIDLPETYTPYRFNMSRSFPIPALPTDNPLIEERVALGEKLFFDTRLSANETISCSSCHKPASGFSDGQKRSTGINRSLTRRHSMPLFNLAWKDRFFWDGRSPSLRAQALEPIENPLEMGETLDNVVAKLKASYDYPAAFKTAFGSGSISAETIGLALEAYQLTLTSYNSKFDQAMQGKAELSEAEKRGFELFMMEFEPRSGRYGADCFHCHGGALFSDHQFHNNGLPITDDDLGLAEVSERTSDQRKFSTPSLRNIALTAPYMHDGRFATLAEVVAHYSSGVEASDTLDPNLAKHPKGGLQLSVDDQAALVAFLRSLTDPNYRDL